jgi:PAS domain S-box-containing protein
LKWRSIQTYPEACKLFWVRALGRRWVVAGCAAIGAQTYGVPPTESQAIASAAVAAAYDAIITIDHRGIVVEWNSAAEHVFGYARSEAIGQEMASLIIPPKLREAHRLGMMHYLANSAGPILRRLVELPALRADGTEFSVDLFITPIATEGRPLFTGFARDATERKAVETAVKKNEERLRLALDASGAGVWSWDQATGLITADEAYRAMYGLAPGETLDYATWEARLHPDDRAPLKRQVEECLNAGSQWLEEFRIVHPQLGKRWLAGLGRVLRDAGGRVSGMTGINLDITARKMAEEAVSASEAQAKKTQSLLMDELNHRVKNTLVTVQAMAEQTWRKSRDPAHFIESFRGRLQALSRAHDLLMRRSWTSIDLESLIREQLLVGPGQDAPMTCSGPDMQLKPREAVHLGLVLHELGTNARKYGALKVPEGRLSVTWHLTGHYLEITWAESGGPTVSPPTRQGFGTLLIERGLKDSLGGEARITFAPTGVTCDMRLPLPELGEGRALVGRHDVIDGIV